MITDVSDSPKVFGTHDRWCSWETQMDPLQSAGAQLRHVLRLLRHLLWLAEMDRNGDQNHIPAGKHTKNYEH